MAYDWLLGLDEEGQLSPDMAAKLTAQLGGGEGGPVTAEDITDATPVGREVLTASSWAAARNAVGIFTGDRALLEEGTSTDLRVWTAADLAAHITESTAVVVAEDLAPITTRLTAVESTIDLIKQANSSMGTGAPTGTAPVGWHYTDITTGDVYRMEA